MAWIGNNANLSHEENFDRGYGGKCMFIFFSKMDMLLKRALKFTLLKTRTKNNGYELRESVFL